MIPRDQDYAPIALSGACEQTTQLFLFQLPEGRLHSETRHRPAVRTVIERIGIMIDNHLDLYSGKRQRDIT